MGKNGDRERPPVQAPHESAWARLEVGAVWGVIVGTLVLLVLGATEVGLTGSERVEWLVSLPVGAAALGLGYRAWRQR